MLWYSRKNRRKLEANAGLLPRGGAEQEATLGKRWFGTFLDLLDFGQKHQDAGGLWAGYGGVVLWSARYMFDIPTRVVLTRFQLSF